MARRSVLGYTNIQKAFNFIAFKNIYNKQITSTADKQFNHQQYIYNSILKIHCMAKNEIPYSRH